jgi:hypothetical protein
MAPNQEHKPGDPAPRSGHYRLLNIFGNETHVRVHASRDHPLPEAPRGFGWRLEHETDDPDEA